MQNVTKIETTSHCFAFPNRNCPLSVPVKKISYGNQELSEAAKQKTRCSKPSWLQKSTFTSGSPTEPAAMWLPQEHLPQACPCWKPKVIALSIFPIASVFVSEEMWVHYLPSYSERPEGGCTEASSVVTALRIKKSGEYKLFNSLFNSCKSEESTIFLNMPQELSRIS